MAGLSIPLALGLFGLGIAVGVVSGLCGVGGGFLLTPMLNVIFGLPFNFAVGTGIFVTLGTSLAGAARHSRLGHVDPKLGFLMALGAIPGVEGGVRAIEILKRAGPVRVLGGQVSAVNFALSLIFVIVLALVGSLAFSESRRALGAGRAKAEPTTSGAACLLPIPPYIRLERAGIDRASVWAILAIGAGAGFAAGLMGVGGGFLLVPAMIYLLGVPTKVAVGTSLFQIIFSSALGAGLHAARGNVLLWAALSVLVGSVTGVQLGALLTVRLPGARIRLYFSLLLFAAAVAVAVKLVARLGLL